MNVVLLHCSMSTGAQWRSLAGRLEARGHRVAAPDLLGYGEAPGAHEADFSAVHEAMRVAACADAAFGSGAPFHVIGHSYGGMVALHLARALPRRVASLVAYEPVCFNLLGRRDRDYRNVRVLAEAIALLVRAGRPFDASRRFYDFWNGDGAFGALPFLQDHFLTLPWAVVGQIFVFNLIIKYVVTLVSLPFIYVAPDRDWTNEA